MLQEYLANTDAPCPACGYDLRGLQGSECPECGEPLVLRIALRDPDIGRFLAAVIGLAMGAGFSGLMTLYFTYHFFAGEMGMRRWPHFFGTTVPFFLVEGFALWLLFRARGRFQRLSARNQAAIIIAAWLLTVTAFVVFSVWVR